MPVSSAIVSAILRVFLDCNDGGCHADYLREEVKLADYVRDRADADVHVLVTRASTGAGGSEYTLSFIGLAQFQAVSRTLKVVTESSDSEDRVRRQLASALTVGLLTYLTSETLPSGLAVEAELSDTGASPSTAATDPWRSWIFSLNGYLNLDTEESTSERNWGLSAGADHITPDWKLTFGSDFNESRDEFELDEGERLSVVRKNWQLDGLAVKSISEHWSVGASSHIRSSTFDNIKLDLRAAPAVEWNFFPYSMYTRRQFRVLYEVGVSSRSYYELTLFGKLDETRSHEELSATYEQREPWGTLEGRVEASNYFPGFSEHRLEVDGEVNVRVARGLSISIEASASRIRDQLSLPRRNASAEEVLLRLRQLQSGFETRVEFGVEYRFGSAFAAIVNPRFGR
jgi:hypothetical protein